MRQDLESLKRGEKSTGENLASVYVETLVHWRYLDCGMFDANSGRSEGADLNL